MRFYIVFIGRIPGMYERWEECKTQVHGYPGNKYKSYDTYDEALAAWEAFEEDGVVPY